MEFLPRLIFGLIVAVSLLSTKTVAGQEQSANSDESGVVGTVEVNGVSEPVYRMGLRGMTIPRVTYNPSPEYTEKARKRKLNGVVLLSVVVTSAGDVTNVQVKQGLGSGLDEKAIEAVRKWKFQPATKDGKPVSIQLPIETDFRLY
jgi:TonB family protein